MVLLKASQCFHINNESNVQSEALFEDTKFIYFMLFPSALKFTSLACSSSVLYNSLSLPSCRVLSAKLSSCFQKKHEKPIEQKSC